MSGNNLKEAILIALIGAGHAEAIELGWELYNGAASEATLNPGVNIGTVTDSSELDARGLPWDSRINAATKTKDKAGNWKYKVGVDREVLVPQVEAELRAALTSNAVSTNPANTATAPLVNSAPPVTTAPPVVANPGLPPVTLPPAVTPTVVEFPVITSAADVTPEKLQQTVAALICKHGAPVAQALLEKFGATDATQIQVGQDGQGQYNFFAYASNDDFLRHISVL